MMGAGRMVDLMRESPRLFVGVLTAATLVGVVLSSAIGFQLARLAAVDEDLRPARVLSYSVTPRVVDAGEAVTVEAVVRRFRDDCPVTVFRQWKAGNDEIVWTRGDPSSPLRSVVDRSDVREVVDRNVIPPATLWGNVQVRGVAQFDCLDATYFVNSDWANLFIRPVAPPGDGE